MFWTFILSFIYLLSSFKKLIEHITMLCYVFNIHTQLYMFEQHWGISTSVFVERQTIFFYC